MIQYGINYRLDPHCPIFRIGDIARLSGETFQNLAVNGSVVSIGIHWDCDLDYDFQRNCRPKYTFRRLDSSDSLAPGWNFRFSQLYANRQRDLYKAYGILFVIDVQVNAIPLPRIRSLTMFRRELVASSVPSPCSPTLAPASAS